MTIRNLNLLFQPRSVVLVGASERPGSIGLHVAENLLRGGYTGEIAFVNPGRDVLLGKPCHRSVEALPSRQGSRSSPRLQTRYQASSMSSASKGCKAAVVNTAGVKGDLAQRMLAAAKPYLLRIIGPNCLGIQIPSLKLDASFAHILGKPGDIALVSQ